MRTVQVHETILKLESVSHNISHAVLSTVSTTSVMSMC